MRVNGEEKMRTMNIIWVCFVCKWDSISRKIGCEMMEETRRKYKVSDWEPRGCECHSPKGEMLWGQLDTGGPKGKWGVFFNFSISSSTIFFFYAGTHLSSWIWTPHLAKGNTDCLSSVFRVFELLVWSWFMLCCVSKPGICINYARSLLSVLHPHPDVLLRNWKIINFFTF